MSNNHALSVFTHSCLSTPRDPRTKLPSSSLDERLSWSAPHSSARLHTTGGIFRHSSSRLNTEKSYRSKPLGASLKPSTSLNGHRIKVQQPSCPDPNITKLLSQSTGSVPPTASLLDPASLSGNVRPSTSSGNIKSDHTDYATLFSTLLESNSLLREEIKKLREEHQKTLSTVEQLHRRDCAVQTNGIKSSSSESNRKGSVTPREKREDRHSRSLPQRLLENTWVESSSEHSQGSFPPPTSSSNSSLSHHDSMHSLEEEALVAESKGELDSLSGSSLDSVSVEEVDAEQIHLDSEVQISAEDNREEDGFVTSSTESLLSSCTDSSRSDNGSKQGRVNEDDPFASPGVVAVEKMWDDFSISDYAPYTREGYGEDGRNTSNGKKEWTPKITVPEPFSMTLREANTPKPKSRSLLLAEQERIRKEAIEEAELRKKFRSSPVPPTTYLPLYELINAKNEQRRDQIKRASKAILESTEKPFSFIKRDNEMRKSKLEALRQSQEFERVEREKAATFIAKPVPRYVFDPDVDEKIQEKEEYRRIKIKMRAEELMSKSKLPGSMQERGCEYTIGALRKKRLEENQARAFLTEEHRFHPTIRNDIPDYDQAYYEFQNQLATRKETKQTTTTKPFYLRTQMIPSRKEQLAKEMEADEEVLPENRWPFVGSRTKVPHVSPKASPSSIPYPAQMTKTAKIRESLTKEKLASQSQKELLEEEERRKKKEKTKLVQQSVSQKSMAIDPTAWLEEKKRQKLQEIRSLDKERREKYKEELKDIEQRVQSRPLLFEQTSLNSLVRSTESKYTAALKKAGLSEDEIQALNSS